jgi:hypothetical protein
LLYLLCLVLAVTCRCREGLMRKRSLVFSPLRGALRASNLPAEDFRTLDTGLPFAHFPSCAPATTRPPLRLFYLLCLVLPLPVALAREIHPQTVARLCRCRVARGGV